MFEEDVRISLELLERATGIIASTVVDDVHLANQTSKLVNVSIVNIKKTFIRVRPGNGSAAASREGSRQQTPHHQHEQEQTVNAGRAGPSQGQDYTNRRVHAMPTDPLAAIQSHSMSDITNQFMPPPNYNFNINQPGFTDNTLAIDPSMNLGSPTANWQTDWLALPLDRFIQESAGTNVDQGFGGIGPTVGGRDMLEIITDPQYNPAQWDGSNFHNAYHGPT